MMNLTQTIAKRSAPIASAVQALAWGLRDGGLEIVTNFPGFYSHELFAQLGGSVTSVNEKTAFAVAWGAAFAGRRSAVLIKNVGLNDAADPFLNSLLLGIRAGLVVVVFDDVEVAGSQCRLDSRHYFDFYGGLWLEPVSALHAYQTARLAFRLSERFQVPVVLRVTNALLRSEGRIRRHRRVSARPADCRRQPRRFVVHPTNSAEQQRCLEIKRRRIQRYVDRQYRLPASRPGDVVELVVGAADPRPAFTGDVRVSLHTYPLPERALRTLVRQAGRCFVHEQGDSFVQQRIGGLLGPARLVRPSPRPATEPGQYRIDTYHERLFAVLRSFPQRLVVGDVGQFTMDPRRTLDACLCLGVSVAAAIGCSWGAPEREVFCVTGDAAFLHGGRTALAEAEARGVRMVLIVLENGGSRSTGGQATPGELRSPGFGATREAAYDEISDERLRCLVAELAAAPRGGVLYLKTNGRKD